MNNKINEYIFNRQQLCITKAMVDDFVTNNIAFRTREEALFHLQNSIITEARLYFYTRAVQPITIKYPKDWFQAFKERFYPKFLLKKYPVAYKTHTITGDEVIADRVLPKNQSFVMLHHTSSTKENND